MTQFFGRRWDAPVVDDAEQVETPVGRRCLDCGEMIVDGDQGFLQQYVTTLDDVVDPEFVIRELGRDERSRGVLIAMHRECQMLGIIGHLVGVCSCSPQVGSRRDQARQAMRRWEASSSRRG